MSTIERLSSLGKNVLPLYMYMCRLLYQRFTCSIIHNSVFGREKCIISGSPYLRGSTVSGLNTEV